MINFIVTVGFLAFASAEPIGRLDGRIIGGHKIDISQVPYQVSLQKYGFHFCGGSIISEKYVLTAAHCVQGGDNCLNIRAGSSNKSSGGSVHTSVKIIRHDFKFVNKMPSNDIAIIEVTPHFEFNENVSPIPLYELKEDIEPDTIALITGWGITSTGSKPSELQGVQVPMISKEQCQVFYEELGTIPVGQICAVHPNGGKDSCQGDSGGPLAVNGHLAGIVSWGLSCGVQGNPGVYTEVAYYLDWIDKQINL